MLYVYLDTSFLSEFVIVHKEKTATSSNNEQWINLLEILSKGVSHEKILCPASQFQTEEAMLAEGIFEEFTSLQFDLSKGYYFRKYQDIVVQQVKNLLLIYLKRAQDIELGWKVFIKIPPPVRDSLETAKSKLNMTQYAENARLLRNKFSRKQSYDDYYKEEKKAFLQQSFLNPESELCAMLISEVKLRKEEILMLRSFLNPDSVESVPFINIFCSLWASTIYHEQTRKYEIGDLLDIVALACAIPYCQIVTTDNNMKNIIKRLHLDEKYRVSVYSPGRKDLILLKEHLCKLGCV